MAIANIFQRLRAQTPALALTGLLAAAVPAFSGNAEAQEPAHKPVPSSAVRLAAHHASEPVFTRAQFPFESAKPDAKQHNRVSFWIVLPEGARITPEDAGAALVAQMDQLGIPAHSFGRNSPSGKGMIVNIFLPDGGYVNPMTGTTDFDLRSVLVQLKTVAEQYQKLQSSNQVALNPELGR